MKVVTAAVYSRFRAYVVGDEGVEQGDGYTVGPKGRVVLGFENVSLD